MLERTSITPSRKIGWIAVMTAACVSTNYMLIGLLNVKFMDLLVFVSGLAFGPLAGGTVGVLTWLVYGTINPFGFSLPILGATCLGESLYGLVGGLIGGSGAHEATSAKGQLWFLNAKYAVVGFLLTFVYDLFTNIVSGASVGIPIPVALIAGIPFALVHEVSNAAFFFIGVVPLSSAIRRLPSGGPSP